ncbi:MAG: PH domain-containing protein, partial [Planctomycetota bacterium]
MAEGQQPPLEPHHPPFEQQQQHQHQQPAPLEPGGPTEMLDQRVVVYWLVSGMASLIVPLGLLLGGTAWVSARWSDHAAMTITAASMVAGFLLAVTVISPPLAYARWRFSVNDELLLVRYGIIWIEEKSIPISRLQHVDVLRGPIERLFGLATLVVFTAGTEGAHFRLPGLA